MELPVLSIKDLSVTFQSEGKTLTAVEQISFDIRRAKITAVIGESGSGKSLTALSVMRLLPKDASVKGNILFSSDNGSACDLTKFSEDQIRKIRGNRIAMIFQEPMTSLNPVHTCGQQVMESVRLHKGLSRQKARQYVIDLFKKVKLPSPEKIFNRYPHQISGGQKQRVMIAIAISCDPVLLIADEPTTALDVIVQKDIIALIKELQSELDMSVLFITHDLGLVADIADDIVVMEGGNIVEKGNAQQVLFDPSQPYTISLLASRPAAAIKGQRIPVIGKADLTELKIKNEKLKTQSFGSPEILAVKDLHVHFPAERSFFGKLLSEYKAVDGVTFSVAKNEIVGLVGESGCGKTTLGRAILQLVKPTSGNIFFGEKDVTKLSSNELRLLRKDLQIVFQDPYGSLNPRITIGEAIEEPLKVHFINMKGRQRKEKMASLLESVKIDPGMAGRHPHRFSGGQKQRISIARALAVDPQFLIFDESVSALDVTVQAQVLNLISELKDTIGFTALFISHDLAVVHYICDRILVMKQGRIIEEGLSADIFSQPRETYTKSLIDAIPGRKLIL